MKKLITISAASVLFAALVITACVTPASAVPISTNPGSDMNLPGYRSFQIDLYEPEPDPSPEFSITVLPEFVVSGFVVLTEFPVQGSDPNSPANWSDVVEFYGEQGSEPNSYAYFWSDKDTPGWAFDVNLPDLVYRVLHGNTVYLVEDDYPTVYDLGYPYDNLYRIWSIPEPATICLLGLGALSLLRRKR